MLKRWLLIVVFFVLNNYAIGQDTIRVDNKSKLNEIVRQGYNNHTDGMTEKIRFQVDSLFRKFDFSTSEYECEYLFMFIVDLDSCGYVQNCDYGNDNYGKKNITLFVDGVRSIILNSNWHIQNVAVLPDTTFYFNRRLVQFRIICDPSEIEYLESSYRLIDHSLVLALSLEGVIYYFDGFKFGCEIQLRNFESTSKKKRKCFLKKNNRSKKIQNE
jgi:hypothetical protein